VTAIPIPPPHEQLTNPKTGGISEVWYRYLNLSSNNAASDLGVYNVKDYGAVGDGVTNDGPACQAAVNAADDAGGGIVFFPPGTYNVGESTESLTCASSGTATDYGIFIFSNIHVVGSGQGATIIQRHSDVSMSPICFYGVCVNASIKHLSINGRWPTFTTGNHGITDDGDTLNVTLTCAIEDVESYNHRSYGIAFENHDLQGCVIDNCYIHDIGGDGIDAKNVNQTNNHNRINNVRIERFALNAAEPSTSGLDIRGAFYLSNIHVYDYGGVSATPSGIRLRDGSTASASGPGASDCVLTNFYCVATNSTDSIGLHSRHVRNSISNGFISGCNVGIREFPAAGDVTEDNIYSNIQIHDCTSIGFLVSGSRSQLVNCKVQNSNIGYIFGGPDSHAIGCRAEDNNTGVSLNGNSTNCILVGMTLVNNTTDVSDSGTGNNVIIADTGGMTLARNKAIPAGGSAGVGYKISATTNFGVFAGSGAPTLTAAQGSMYLRSDGSSTVTRAYINTAGTTVWTAIITAA
jgi:hypothetical protein